MSNGDDQMLLSDKMPATRRENVIRGVGCQRIKSARRKLAIFLGLAVLASAAVIAALVLFTDEFSRSGIHQYLSLILTDSDAVIDFWKDFLLMFVESFPIAALIAALAGLIVLLYSVKIIFRNVKTAMAKVRLAK